LDTKARAEHVMESCAHPLLDTLPLQNRRMRSSMCLVLLLFLRLCISVYITHSCSLLYLGVGEGEKRYNKASKQKVVQTNSRSSDRKADGG